MLIDRNMAEPVTRIAIFTILCFWSFFPDLFAAASFKSEIDYTEGIGFIVTARGNLSVEENCFASGFERNQGVTYLSSADDHCNEENYHGSDYDFTTAYLHLRLDMSLKRIDQQHISGSGIQPTSSDPTLAYINFDSNTADLMSPNYGHYMDFVGTTVPNPPFLLYSAFIENGCVGSPTATFHLNLKSGIYTDFYEDQSLGTIELHDQVIGHGYYNFNFTVRAEDDEGNITDFTFSGDANSTCVAEISLN